MTTRIELETEEYNDFLKCLLNLKEICNDVDIRNGIIRQRSNDLNSVFEMNLSPIINDINIPISNLKKKLDLLKTFVGNSVTIEIEERESESDSFFIISDDLTSIKFLFPCREFMDNKIMTEEERDNIFDLNEEELILNNQISSLITDRIRIITDNFNTEALRIDFDHDKASILATTQSKDQVAKFKTDIPMNMDFERNCISNLSVVPFGLEHDIDLDFKMYKDPSQNISLNKISTELGSVAINVYSRSMIMDEEED